MGASPSTPKMGAFSWWPSSSSSSSLDGLKKALPRIARAARILLYQHQARIHSHPFLSIVDKPDHDQSFLWPMFLEAVAQHPVPDPVEKDALKKLEDRILEKLSPPRGVKLPNPKLVLALSPWVRKKGSDVTDDEQYGLLKLEPEEVIHVRRLQFQVQEPENEILASEVVFDITIVPDSEDQEQDKNGLKPFQMLISNPTSDALDWTSRTFREKIRFQDEEAQASFSQLHVAPSEQGSSVAVGGGAATTTTNAFYLQSDAHELEASRLLHGAERHTCSNMQNTGFAARLMQDHALASGFCVFFTIITLLVVFFVRRCRSQMHKRNSADEVADALEAGNYGSTEQDAATPQ
ncbi:unnamed protein product [Amoebophrya sp. A25]|nr:unnamed protein product [Amoebophrya sp. A25]|eukprot:GSA25T00020680001.1